MKLHFDPNQQYQHEAINAIVRVFEGQPLNHGDFSFTIDNRSIITPIGGVGNQLTISNEQILANVQTVQKENEITVCSENRFSCSWVSRCHERLFHNFKLLSSTIGSGAYSHGRFSCHCRTQSSGITKLRAARSPR